MKNVIANLAAINNVSEDFVKKILNGLYKTAKTSFGYVAIVGSFFDADGKLIVQAKYRLDSNDIHLFRLSEIDNFCL